MSTLTESMDAAVAELKATRIANEALSALVTTELGKKTTQAQTVINQFIARPPITTVFVDEVNGSDANDGATLAAPRKTLDAVVGAMGNNSTSILLLSNATFRQRNSLFAGLTITGIQRSANAQGYVPFKRKISFLGTAENSPQSDETFPAGAVIYGEVLRTVSIDFELPDVPSGQTYRAHFVSLGSNFTFSSPTITVGSPQAGALVGALVSRATVFINPVLGQGAPGHVFAGVGAGADPNASWIYSSNLNAA